MGDANNLFIGPRVFMHKYPNEIYSKVKDWHEFPSLDEKEASKLHKEALEARHYNFHQQYKWYGRTRYRHKNITNATNWGRPTVVWNRHFDHYKRKGGDNKVFFIDYEHNPPRKYYR
jgi:hypothetical protein